jgi:hypothetical protein
MKVYVIYDRYNEIEAWSYDKDDCIGWYNRVYGYVKPVVKEKERVVYNYPNKQISVINSLFVTADEIKNAIEFAEEVEVDINNAISHVSALLKDNLTNSERTAVLMTLDLLESKKEDVVNLRGLTNDML